MAYQIKKRQFFRDLVVIALIAICLGMATLSFAQEVKPRSLTPHKTFEMVLNDPGVLFVDRKGQSNNPKSSALFDAFLQRQLITS